MTQDPLITLADTLTEEKLKEFFPPERSNEFFEALFGDASEGSYDIELACRSTNQDRLVLEFRLHERPGCCLACNLTQGLPQVFSRHPLIDVAGLVQRVDDLLGDGYSCGDWSLGYTEQQSPSLHIIPINITLDKN